MDSFVRVLPLSKRPFGPIQVGWIGAWGQRSHATERRCEHVYLMWITTGQGSITVDHQHFTIQAPCLIATRPQTAIAYQPTGTWDEYFAICEPQAEKLLTPTLRDHPVLPLLLSPTLKSLLDTWAAPYFAQAGDEQRIDSLVHFALLESLRCAQTSEDPLLDLVRQCQQAIDSDPAQPILPAEAARKAGVSRSTWERAWKSVCGLPPARYHLQRRLEDAARLLETQPHMSITAVATAIGYDDPMYFSRRFRNWCQLSPRAYRQKLIKVK